MVKVDYSDKNGGPQAMKDENGDTVAQGGYCRSLLLWDVVRRCKVESFLPTRN